MKLLQRVEAVCRVRRYSPRTAQAYTHWIGRYLKAVRAPAVLCARFDDVSHPGDDHLGGRVDLDRLAGHAAGLQGALGRAVRTAW